MITKLAEVELKRFNKKFYSSIPVNKRFAGNFKKDSKKFTVFRGKEKVSVVDYRKYPAGHFWNIRIPKEHRGTGVLQEASDQILKKKEVPFLLATINKKNKASVLSHKHSGFKKAITIQKRLEKKGLFSKNSILLKKSKPT